MNGLGQAAIPIVGYNYGTRQPERVRSAFCTALPMAAGIALLATAVFCAIPGWLLQLFDADANMLALGIPALRTISFTFVFASVTMILAMPLPALETALSIWAGTSLRQVIIFVPLVWILAKTAGIGSVWYAFWASRAGSQLLRHFQQYPSAV